MNTLDVIFLILIGASVLYSLIRGLVREIFSFLSIILGFFGASYGYSSVAQWLKRWITNETLAHILAFAILFIIIALVIGLLGRLLSRLIHKGGLGWADRMGGAAFGLLKAFLRFHYHSGSDRIFAPEEHHSVRIQGIPRGPAPSRPSPTWWAASFPSAARPPISGSPNGIPWRWWPKPSTPREASMGIP